ncbi:MAG TPA: hypothetical protein VFC31_10435 [Candidatus Limnocylindria bacterium]|nr:hypothetical protein [Candidatus Limnocylindria bacterium]
MDDIFRILVQFLHVFTGVLWLGGGLYTLFVQTPAFMAAPPQARGPVLGQVVPRQVTYLLRLGEITIATGILNFFATGRGREIENILGSRWAIAIVIGALLAIALLALGHAVIKPSAMRLLAVGPKAAAGDAAAGAEAGAIIARLRTVGYAQIVLGVAIILAMVTARLS